MRSLSFIFLLTFSLLSFAAAPIHHKVVVDGHPMAVWEKSPPNPRATILLLHGRTYSARPDFDLQVEGENRSFMDGLTALGYRVYALDARGYGDTPRDASGWLTPDRSVKDAIAVAEWIKVKHPEQLHLYGWSYGSMVSQLAVQRAPTLFASTILFGYPFNPDRHVVTEDFEYPARPPAKPNTASHAASDFITPGSISQKAIDAYVLQALAADPIRVDFKDLHQWAELDASKVTTPTLLIQGEFDPIASTPIQQRLFTNINTAKKWWVVLEGGDHAALLEKPAAEMLNAMDAFIRSL